MLMKMLQIISGVISRVREMPEAFRAVSSLFSPICPRVIIEASSVASGRASGRAWLQTPQKRNSMMTLNPRPRPTSSSMYSQRNCIIRMKMTTSRIAKNGPTNDLTMNLSNFFILFPLYFFRFSSGFLPVFLPVSRE